MERKHSADIDNLIALCHIIDDFEEFEKRLLNVITSKYNRDFTDELWYVSVGKTLIGSSEAENFYNENKRVIDTINKYSTIFKFIDQNYGLVGEIIGDIHFFYEYVIKHKDKMDKILAVLEKLKKLRFMHLEFDETENFTNDKYVIYTQYSGHFTFSYLDQMEAIPSYRYGVIKYRTKESPYQIAVEASGADISYRVINYRIQLNDLTFEANRLPSTLSKEEIFDKILELPKEKQQQYSFVKNSVDLEIGIADLYAMFNTVYDKINSLSEMDEKEELIKSLETIKEAISKMQTISSKYDQKIVENNPNISQADLNEEKEEYARRRKLQNRHSS